MNKFYASIFSIALFVTGSHLHAQNTNDKALLDLVRKNAAQLHLSPADADNVMISHSFTDHKTNIQYVYLQQAYQQIKVYNSIMTVIFRDNDVLYSSGKFVENLEEKAGAAVALPAIPAEQAINNAAIHLKLPVPYGLKNVENKFATEKKMIFSPAGIARENIGTELMWVAADDGSWVKLAWNVNIDELRSADWWNVRIDATTGAFLEKNNWTVHEQRATVSDEKTGDGNAKDEVLTRVETDGPGPLTLAGTQNKTITQYSPPTVTNGAYYVSQQPSESPRQNPMVLVNEPWLRAGVGNPAITDGWQFDGTTNYDITSGNNVHAYLDLANSNSPLTPGNIPASSTTPIPSLTFNYVPDFTQQPALALNRQAAITNLFYWNNTVHDILYQYGFDEVSGNFQTDNLGRGGLGNDYVQAEGQDGGGTDNANFATPADGSKPRMQMYLWSGVPVFTVNSPAVIAGNYFATESGFSTANKLINTGPKTAQVVYYNDDLAGTIHEACGVPANSITGKIALINRGTCAFTVKVKDAQNAGAIAVIMVNNAPGFPITMGGTDNTITIPAVMLSQSDGALLAAQLANNVNVTLAAGVGIDGDLDNGVIAHEYGHGVSNRLTGGAPNSGCLGNAEQGGEGWSDYLALMQTTNWATANLTDGTLPRPLGIYAVGQPLNGTGIRTFPYSTDMTINPHTYTDVANPAQAGEVHYIGEIWCEAIWDMTWFIIQQEGTINPNIYNSTVGGGNSIALKLVLEGMRLQTCRPGFLDARDAIIAADSVLYNGRHKCAIWAAFARRGMGVSAVQGSSNNTTDGIAAFDVPSSVQLNKQATPLTVVQGEQVAVKLTATCQCQVNTNYTIKDTIPAGFTYVSSTGGILTGNVVTFPTLNFLATQETKTYSVVIQPNNPGCAITTNINDNRDGNTVGGFTSVIATGTTNWVTSTARSTSPTTSWFAASSNTNRDFSLTSGAAGFTAGSLSVLSFKHFFITKNTIEGGRVEYSINGGTTWLDAGSLIIQSGYNNTSSVATPWGVGQKMFGGVSYGRGSGQFINTIVDLSSLSGQNVRVRLRSRGTTTNQGTFEGWYIDDILQMDGCGGIVKAGLYNGANTRVDSLASPVFIKTGIPVTITSQPSDITVCAGSNAVFTAMADPATSPTYQWQISTDGGASFTDIPGQTTASLTIPAATTAMSGYKYRLVVSSSLSSGFIMSNIVTLTVNPIPTVNAVFNLGLCNGSSTGAINFSGAVAGTVFNWTNNTPSIGLAASGSGNITSFIGTNAGNSPLVATITVTPAYTNAGVTCTGAPTSFTITVNPTPSVNAVANQSLCNNSSVAAITFSGAVAGTVFNWTNNTISIGLAAGGTGNIGSFVATNATNAPVVATITVTPSYTNVGVVCTGTPRTFTITVNPTPTVAAVTSQTICAGTSTAAVTFTGAVAGTVFNWTNNTTSIGLAASGSGNVASFTAVNNGTTPVVATITVTPSYTNAGVTCSGTPATFTITVNPRPTVTCPANIVVNAVAGTCAATVNYPAATATGTPVPTITYSTASGSSFPVGVTTITVTATNICGTATCSFTITVNDVQVPAITSQPVNKTVCTGSSATFSVVSTNVASYQWQSFNGTAFVNIAGANTVGYTVSNTTVSMNTNSFRVIITGPCGTTATSNVVTLYVNPLPTISLSTSIPPVLLPGQFLTITATTSPVGGTYAWYKNGVLISGAISNSLVNLSVDDIGTYKVIYTDPNGCVSTSADLVISAQQSGNLYVFPNPNSGHFHVRFYNQLNEPATLRVYDSRGAMVYQKKFITTTPYSSLDVNLEARATPNGIYLVEVRNGTGILIGAKRIIVERP